MEDTKQPEALRLANALESRTTSWGDKAAAAAELRRQHARIAELEVQLEAVGAGGVQALSAAPAGWKLVPVEPTGVMLTAAEIAIAGAGKTLGRYNAYAAAYSALLAASPTPPAEQQAALKASPSDIAKLRHLYANLKNGGVRDTAQAKRIADGLLAPIIERMEQAATKAAPGEPTPELQRMTAGRAAYFMERFLREEKLLGPNEQAAVQFALNMLEAASQQEAQEPWGYARKSPGCGWHLCSKRHHKEAVADGCETKKLYTAPQPAPSPLSEREAFETWYCKQMEDAGYGSDCTIHQLREENHYGVHRVMLNGKWEGWQARADLAAQGGQPGPAPTAIDELEQETRLMRARMDRLQAERDGIAQAIVERLERACGATSMPPTIIRKEFMQPPAVVRLPADDTEGGAA